MADPDVPEDTYETEELDEPRRPTAPAPAPLPRLWKAAPEPEVSKEEVAPPSKKKRRATAEAAAESRREKARSKKKSDEPIIDDGTGAIKLEETPILDTYEARQRIRWAIGTLFAAIGLISLVVIVRSFRHETVEELPGDLPEQRIAQSPAPNSDRAATNLLETARRADQAGKTEVALDQLNKLVQKYQGTPASLVAMKAIDRHGRKLPMFGTDAPDLEAGPKPPPAAKVAATPPSPPPKPPVILPGLSGPVAPSAPEGGVSIGSDPTRIAVARPIDKPLPSGFHASPASSVHSSGWPTRIVCDRDGAEMVLVPGNTFLMGREDGDPAERPAHRVSLSTYYLDQHEVTVRQYLQFLKDSGRPLSSFKSSSREKADPPITDDHPAVNITAREAKEYCLWANKRLPTEAQWEMAARSPDGRISFWNGELPRKDPPRGPRPMEVVMSLPSDVSPYGAFDLGANAWEWTSEYFDSQYYQQFRRVVADPTGPKESRAKLVQVTVKGGSPAGILTWREGVRIEYRLPYLGFRGALPVEGPPVATVSPTPTTIKPGLPSGDIPF